MSKKERAEVLRKKGNRYYTGASDKAMESGSSSSNVVSELGNKKSSVTGRSNAMRRIGEVDKKSGSESDSGNVRRERLEALLAIGEIKDKEYKKRKKEMK